jgi:hypothetical protein
MDTSELNDKMWRQFKELTVPGLNVLSHFDEAYNRRASSAYYRRTSASLTCFLCRRYFCHELKRAGETLNLKWV